MRKVSRIDQGQIAKAHILHCTGDGPDVSGVGGSDEYDSYGHLLRDSLIKVRYSTAPAAQTDSFVWIAQFFDIDGIQECTHYST